MKSRFLPVNLVRMAPLLVAGCRFGGLGGSAIERIEPAVDGGLPLDDGSDDPGPSSPEETGDGDEAAVGDGDDSSDVCESPAEVPGCDPVKGINCTPGINQCVVDPEATMAAGRCVFPSAPSAMGCEENGLYTTCPTGFTCKQRECRKYCYCDTDCDQGDTCSEPSEQGSSDLFKLCMNTRA